MKEATRLSDLISKAVSESISENIAKEILQDAPEYKEYKEAQTHDRATFAMLVEFIYSDLKAEHGKKFLKLDTVKAYYLEHVKAAAVAKFKASGDAKEKDDNGTPKWSNRHSQFKTRIEKAVLKLQGLSSGQIKRAKAIIASFNLPDDASSDRLKEEKEALQNAVKLMSERIKKKKEEETLAKQKTKETSK